MNTKKGKQGRRVLKRYTAEDRVKFVEAYKNSGQSQSVFCHENEINPTTFYGWLGKTPKKKTKFVEVSLPSITKISAKQDVEVKLVCGTQVNIPSDMAIEQIADLIRRVTAC